MTAGNSFYQTAGWYRLRAKTKALWRREGRLCGVCQQQLAWTEKYGVIVDHIINRWHRPDLALEPSNVQCVCHACNTRKAHFVEGRGSAVKPEVGLDGFDSSWRE